jgi:phosphoglycolate phosphatase
LEKLARRPIRGGDVEVNGRPEGKLIVFDLDGTLIDSRRDLAESANRMLASYGAAPLPVDSVAGMVGEGARILVERALAATGLDPREPEALRRFLAAYDEELLVHTRPYEGVVAALEEVSSVAPIAVLTNKPEAPTRRLLEVFGMDPFVRWSIGGDSGFARKPDPAGLRSLVSSAGARPDTTLLVGDSMVDVETARRAGTRMCLARYGFGGLRGPLVLAGEEWDVGDPRDLVVALRRFLDR